MVRKGIGNRHAARFELAKVRCVAEIGKRYDGFAADSRHFAHQAFDVAHRLQGLRQDHGIEREVIETAQPALEVALQHIDTVHQRRQDIGVIDLDAVALDAARLGQKFHQAAVAAA